MTAWWKFLPASVAHDFAPVGLRIYSGLSSNIDSDWQSFTWRGLRFRNPMGIAGGVDKDGEQILDWQKMGAGFVEVGTVTPSPQRPNPGKILDRDWDSHALWNRMGFPSQGASEVAMNLTKARSDLKVPIFLNIGKNRTTPNEQAVDDYRSVAKRLKHLVDGFVINVSSPNTKGLRDLQSKEVLQKLVSSVIDEAKISKDQSGLPVLIKLSPDMTDEALFDCLEAGINAGASGFILSNTTVSRPQNSHFPEVGGLSGKPLKSLSEACLVKSIGYLRQNFPSELKNLLIISAGGIMSPADVARRLELGANLVQVYAALVFHGPKFFHKVIEEFANESGSEQLNESGSET